MKNSYKKLEAILCLIAGVGLFLPLLTVSGYGSSASVSFMTGFDMSKMMDSGAFNSKIVLGVLIVAFIVLIVRTLNRDSFGIKMVSFLLIIASLVLFYINVDKLASVKSIVSSMIKYGIGYYISLIGLIAAFILGLLDLFKNNNTDRDIDEMERILNAYHTNNTYQTKPNSMNPASSVQPNGVPPVNNTPIPPVTGNSTDQTNNTNNVGIKLSELVNHSETTNNSEQNNTINNNNGNQ